MNVSNGRIENHCSWSTVVTSGFGIARPIIGPTREGNNRSRSNRADCSILKEERI